MEHSMLLKLMEIREIHLSLSLYQSIESKDLLSESHTKDGRIKPSEHLDYLFREGRLKDQDQPLLVISCRNVLANPRCIGFINGKNEDRIITVKDEIINEDRSYFVLGGRNNHLQIKEFSVVDLFENSFPFDWFISGVPVLWNDLNGDELLEIIITEATDYSHVWKIPRGKNPNANDETRRHWDNLRMIFNETIQSSRKVAFKELLNYACENHLEREDKYFHNILGVDKNGNLFQYASKGKLEDLGKILVNYGVERAIMVDNSGSVSTFFYPKGINGPEIQLIAAPNYRPAGTAFLVVELENALFK